MTTYEFPKHCGTCAKWGTCLRKPEKDHIACEKHVEASGAMRG